MSCGSGKITRLLATFACHIKQHKYRASIMSDEHEERKLKSLTFHIFTIPIAKLVKLELDNENCKRVRTRKSRSKGFFDVKNSINLAAFRVGYSNRDLTA